jgi:hypothetical protein
VTTAMDTNAALVQLLIPRRPMTADEIVASAAAMMAGEMFLQGKRPSIAGAEIVAGLAARSLSASDFAAVKAFAASNAAPPVIANAIAVAANVLRLRAEKTTASVSQPAVQEPTKPVAQPTKPVAQPTKPPITPIRVNQKGRDLV